MPRKANTNSDHYYDPFPTQLRKLMRERKMNQTELSKVLGFDSRQAVAKYTDGTVSPTADKICKLADYFGVSTDYLLGRTEIKTPNVELQAICNCTGLDEEAAERLYWYTGDTFYRFLLGRILKHTELFAVLQAATRAVEAEEVWKSSGRKIVTSGTEFKVAGDGEVTLPVKVAVQFYESYAVKEFSFIAHDVIRDFPNTGVDSKGSDADGDSDTEG